MTLVGDDRENLRAQMELLISPLQGQTANPFRGKVQQVLLADLQWRTDQIGSTVAVTGQSGSLLYTIVEQSVYMTIDTYGFLTLSVSGTAPTQILFRLPEGLSFVHRLALSGQNSGRTIGTAIVSNSGAYVPAFVVMSGETVAFQLTSGSWAAGGVGFYGQFYAEVALPGQQ